MGTYESLPTLLTKFIKKIRQVMVKFNMETEGKILRHLESKDNMQAYIKMLIKQDMEKASSSRGL